MVRSVRLSMVGCPDVRYRHASAHEHVSTSCVIVKVQEKEKVREMQVMYRIECVHGELVGQLWPVM